MALAGALHLGARLCDDRGQFLALRGRENGVDFLQARFVYGAHFRDFLLLRERLVLGNRLRLRPLRRDDGHDFGFLRRA